MTATSHGLYRGRTARYYAMWGRHRTRQLQAALARITHLKWQLRQRHASVPARTLAQSHGYSVWDRLADCESGGNWADTAGSFEGGLQFLNSTWLAHGGGAYAAHAYSASREQQIVIAERVLADQGWSAWPACSAKLGLR